MTTQPSNQRYTDLKKVGSGDFATTYSAHDNRLNREVAIKQLHSQYLDDETRLARYWREAQLLASLEHPNNMTIYDVDRAKGRLVLELMQGSLRQIYAGRPMPVEDVRQTLVQALRGLQCLHENGIVHGDLNPNNLFLSRQNVVKLGDFGLARRVEDDDGSLLKGTTRYIAPEIVSEEFGKVGPPSDLYSLGFSALDLLVGPEFESLFPDLIAFGRDRKMAWMMWHCSADRKLPQVNSILEGVPADLAKVITRLTTKEQSQRYKTAAGALQDLSANPVPVGQSLKEEAAAAAALARARKNKRRRFALAACAMSVLLSAVIIWFMLEPPAPPPRIAPPPVVGVVQNVLPIDGKLVLDLGADWKELKLTGNDIVTLNRKKRQLRDLQDDDRVTIHTRLDPDNRSHLDVIAFRPETHAGLIESVDLEKPSVQIRVTEGGDAKVGFSLFVPENTPIEINKSSGEKETPLTVASLAVGDRVVIRHSDDEAGMLALSIEALRDVELNGFVREMDVRKRLITIAPSEAEENLEKFIRIPLATECVFTLNGLSSLNEKLVGFSDVQPGDQVTVRHDSKAKSIAAFRIFREQGRIEGIDIDQATVRAKLNGTGTDATWAMDSESEITLGGKPVSLDDLRAGDVIDADHDSPGMSVPILDRVMATRPADKNKWAILIGNEAFDDPGISPLVSTIDNVQALREVLTERYAVPAEQTFVCENFERARLEHEIATWLGRVPAKAELIVYLGTRARLEPQENVYLVVRDSERDRIRETGLGLDWLIDRLDSCPAAKKALFLDCTHASSDGVFQAVSPVEMLDNVRAKRRGGYPRTLFVLGSCRRGQVGAVSPGDSQPDSFGSAIASGFAGGADTQRDNQIEITELSNFVESTMKSVVHALDVSQSPELFLPDPTPPRISSEGKEAVLELLVHFEDRKLDLDAISFEAGRASELCGGQPDADLALGFVLFRHDKLSEALEVLDAVRVKSPGQLLAHRAVIWLHFQKSQFDTGFEKLQMMVKRLPEIKNGSGEFDASTLKILEWAGQFRELAESAEWVARLPSPQDLEAYDQLIKAMGEQAMARHTLGREKVRSTVSGFVRSMKNEPNGNASIERQRFRNYVESIANQEAIISIRTGLDK